MIYFFLICRSSGPRLHQKQLTCAVGYWSIHHQQDSYLWSPVHTASLMNYGILIQNYQMVVNYPHFLISHLKVWRSFDVARCNQPLHFSLLSVIVVDISENKDIVVLRAKRSVWGRAYLYFHYRRVFTLITMDSRDKICLNLAIMSWILHDIEMRKSLQDK